MRRALAALLLAGCGAARAAVPPAAEIPVAPMERARPAPAVVRPAPPPAPAPVAAARVGANGCPDDMVAVESFCIDRYEAPNEKGEMPYALQTAYDGEAWCAERGKRLCTETEWVRACTGPHARRFPYGDEHRDAACNDDKPWIGVHWKTLARWPHEEALDEAAHLFQADMSGARAGCVSEEGVYDLTGNVAEWVRRSVTPRRPGYDHVLKGCYWAGCFKEPRPSCAFANRAHPGSFRTYEAGFRCCAERSTALPSRR